jgi:hypothetical protein
MRRVDRLNSHRGADPKKSVADHLPWFANVLSHDLDAAA